MRIGYFFIGMILSMPASAERWTFDVFLDKQKIGTHSFEYDQQRLHSKASFDVKFLFIHAYHYRHQAEEQWQGNCLQQLNARTEENKEITLVSATQQPGQLHVAKTVGDQTMAMTLPACVMTFAYWNPHMLTQTRLLNPQNAEFVDVKIEDQGLQNYLLRGQSMQAQQYQLTGSVQGKVKLKITLWYDQQQWLGLKSVTPEGHNIYYKLN